MSLERLRLSLICICVGNHLYLFGFCFQAVALQSQDSDEGVLLQFEKGDVILIYTDKEEETVSYRVCLRLYGIAV